MKANALRETTTTVTILFANGETVDVDDDLPFRVHVENAAKLRNAHSVQSTDGTRIYYFKG